MSENNVNGEMKPEVKPEAKREVKSEMNPMPAAKPPAAPPEKKDPFKEALKPVTQEEQLKLNLGTRGVRNLPAPKFPNADLAVRAKGIRRPAVQNRHPAGQPAHARRRDLDSQPAPRGPPQPRKHDLAAGGTGADGGHARRPTTPSRSSTPTPSA